MAWLQRRSVLRCEQMYIKSDRQTVTGGVQRRLAEQKHRWPRHYPRLEVFLHQAGPSWISCLSEGCSCQGFSVCWCWHLTNPSLPVIFSHCKLFLAKFWLKSHTHRPSIGWTWVSWSTMDFLPTIVLKRTFGDVWHWYFTGQMPLILPGRQLQTTKGNHTHATVEWRPPGLSVCLPLVILSSTIQPLRFSDAPLLSAARTRTEFARWAFSVAAPHTWNSLPSDIRSCHTLHTFKKTSKHTCSDSLNLKPPAPPYPLQDFKALYKCCIIIIKSRRSFLLAPAHVGSPRKRAVKWLWCGGVVNSWR